MIQIDRYFEAALACQLKIKGFHEGVPLIEDYTPEIGEIFDMVLNHTNGDYGN